MATVYERCEAMTLHKPGLNTFSPPYHPQRHTIHSMHILTQRTLSRSPSTANTAPILCCHAVVIPDQRAVFSTALGRPGPAVVTVGAEPISVHAP